MVGEGLAPPAHYKKIQSMMLPKGYRFGGSSVFYKYYLLKFEKAIYNEVQI